MRLQNEGTVIRRELGQAPAEVAARPVASGRLGRVARAVFWLCAGGTVFAWVCPAMLTRTDWPSVLVSHAACMALTFGLQLGVGCAVLAVVLWVIRARRMCLGAVLIAALWLVPEGWKWVRPVSVEGAVPERETLTVLSMNVLFGHGRVRAIEHEAAACGADVVVFQEYTPGLDLALSGAMQAYPFRVCVAREDAYGQAVFSKRPFEAEPELYPSLNGAGGRPRITVGVRFDGGVVGLTNVHLVSPITMGRLLDQRREVVGLADEVRRTSSEVDEKGVRVERVLAGDFNGTGDAPIVRAVVEAGLNDSWVEGARGRGGTWPAYGLSSNLGRVRIDHVLHSGGLVCVAAGVGGSTGSDHFPTWARYVRRR